MTRILLGTFLGSVLMVLQACAVSDLRPSAVTQSIAANIVELHQLACDEKNHEARAALIVLYRQLVDSEYPEGGVCNDPLGVLEYLAAKERADAS